MEEKQTAKQQSKVMEYFVAKRNNQAKVFPHRGQDASIYINTINGAKLSKASVTALKRG